MSNDDDLIASALRKTEPPPLGLTARLEAGVLRREREAGGLTVTEGVCVVAVCGLLGVGGGPLATLVALLVGVAYARLTILVEA
jgi:hypothetical protein